MFKSVAKKQQATTLRVEVLYTHSFFLICFTYVAGWLSQQWAHSDHHLEPVIFSFSSEKVNEAKFEV